MSSKTAFLSPVISDAATLSAGSAVNGAAATNLQDPRATLYWQSLTSGQWLAFFFPGGQVPNALFLGYLNIGGANQNRTIQIRRGTTLANTVASPTMNTGAVSVENAGRAAYLRAHLLYLFTASGSGSWWRIDFSWGSTTDGFVRAARAILGTTFVPVNSADPGWSMQGEESVVEAEDIGSGLSTRPRGARRTLSLGWANGGLTVDEGATLAEMMLERGSARDLVCCVDTTETTHPMSVLACGRVKQAFSMKHVPVAYRSAGLAIEETGITEMVR